jgi:type VI secretion system secreted protein Hcp
MAETQNQNFFLNLKSAGIDGESTKTSHPGKDGWMEAASWSFSMQQSADAAVGQQAGTGTAALGTFTFERVFDKASPLLFERCARGMHIPTATFDAERTGLSGGATVGRGAAGTSNTVVYFKLNFKDLVITNRSVSHSPNQRGSESLSFAFGHVEMTHTQVTTDGRIGTSTTKIYDVKQNRAS